MEKIEKMKRDFVIIVLSFVVMTLIILNIIPLDRTWIFVAIVDIAMSFVLQWFWTKHFKNN